MDFILSLLFIYLVYLLCLRVDVDTSRSFEQRGVHQDQDQYQNLFEGKSWSFDHTEPMISKVYCFIQLHAIFIQIVLGLAISYCHYTFIDYLNAMNPLSP